MWPSSTPSRIAAVVILLVITYSFASNMLRARPAAPTAPVNEGEPLEVNAVRTIETGHRAQLKLAGLSGSVSIKTGRPQEVTLERLSQTQPGRLDGPAAALPVSAEGNRVLVGNPLTSPGAFGVFPGETRQPVPADLRITVADDAAVDLTDFDGKVTITAVQGGVSIRGGKVQADLTSLGSKGLALDIAAGQVNIEGVGGACNLSLGDASLMAMQLSCQELNVTGRRSLHVEDGNALGVVQLTSEGGNITVARVRAEQLSASTGGAIEMSDATVDGPLTLQAKSGAVSLARLGAETLSVTAERGAVELSDVRGEMDIAAANADINLRRVTSERLNVKGGSGEVQVSGNLQRGKGHEIRTTGGAVSVYVPKEASLALQADAGSGRVTLDPAFRAPSGRSSVNSQFNGGNVPLTILSGGGAIRVLTGSPMF